MPTENLISEIMAQENPLAVICKGSDDAQESVSIQVSGKRMLIMYNVIQFLFFFRW